MSDTAPIEHPTWLTSGDFTEADEPLRLFSAWFEEAKRLEPADPNAMALATVDPDGLPNVRMVLLKDFDQRGFVFYTNLDSRKGRELQASPKAALVFHWKSLMRQVRLRGAVEPVSEAEADAYFATRPRLAQIGAWASRQSTVIGSRDVLDSRYAELLHRWPKSTKVPIPGFWGGYRVAVVTAEFWQGGINRLHDRFHYRRDGERWVTERLSP